MPPTILYICGGMIIAVIVSYALFDLSRPTYMSQAEREAKRMAKEKKKYKRYTDAVIEYATQKDAEAKAFRDKHSEPLTYFHPPEDNAESACNETDVPMQADPDVKPDTEENQTADVEATTEEILEEIPSEATDEPSIVDMPTEEITRRVIEGIRNTAPTSEISEPDNPAHEISHTDPTLESAEIIEDLPQDEQELLEEDNSAPTQEDHSASSVPAELAQNPTGLNSEAESQTEEAPKPDKKQKKKHGFKIWGKKKDEPEPEPTEAEPEISTNLRNSEDFAEKDLNTEQSEPQIETDVVTNDEPNTETDTEPLEEVETTESNDFQKDATDTADPAEYDFSEAQQNPYIGPELQPEVLPEENESEIYQDGSEIYQEQDDNFPNDLPNEESPAQEQAPAEDFNGRILHLRKTADGLEYHPEDEHRVPENAWQGYPEIQNTPEGEVHDFEPGAEPGPDNIIQMPADWYKGVPDEEEDIPNNITPLYTEYANQVPDGWEDYPDTEIISEDTTDKEIPDTDSFISNGLENKDKNGPTGEE